MADIRYIDKDFVTFNFSDSGGDPQKAILAFGDKVEVLEEGTGAQPSSVHALELFDGSLEGTVKGKPFRGREKGVLKFSMIDVQQGDGMILETPPDENDETRVVFIDGDDNKLFARHVAARYITERAPQPPLGGRLNPHYSRRCGSLRRPQRHQALRNRTRHFG